MGSRKPIASAIVSLGSLRHPRRSLKLTLSTFLPPDFPLIRLRTTGTHSGSATPFDDNGDYDDFSNDGGNPYDNEHSANQSNFDEEEMDPSERGSAAPYQNPLKRPASQDMQNTHIPSGPSGMGMERDRERDRDRRGGRNGGGPPRGGFRSGGGRGRGGSQHSMGPQRGEG